MCVCACMSGVCMCVCDYLPLLVLSVWGEARGGEMTLGGLKVAGDTCQGMKDSLVTRKT